jgi:hypothetical protein
MVLFTWNAFKEDITRERNNNEEVCKWFLELNKEASRYFDNKLPPIYRRPP